MASRTFKVADLLQSVNHVLAATDSTREGRQVATVILTTVLHKTGNYAGFRYLDGWPCEDDSRREYFWHRRLGPAPAPVVLEKTS